MPTKPSDPLDFKDTVSVVTTPIQIWVGSVALSSIFLLAWGVFGRIPQTQTAKGLITVPYSLATVPQTGSIDGVFTDIMIQPGTYISKGAPMAKLKYIALEDSVEQNQQSLLLKRRFFEDIYQSDLYKRYSVELSNSIANNRLYLEKAAELADDGYISQSTVRSAKQQYQQSIEQKLNHTNQRQQAIEGISEVENTLKQSKTKKLQSSIVKSPYSGKVINLFVDVGQQNSPGQPLAQIQSAIKGKPLQVLAFFDLVNSAKLKPGQAVHILPDNIKPNTVGNLFGVVQSVEDLPVTSDEINPVVGSSALSKQLIPSGSLVQVQIRLVRDSTSPSGYKWINGRGPSKQTPLQFPRAGLLTSVTVITNQVPPITIAIPALKRFFDVN